MSEQLSPLLRDAQRLVEYLERAKALIHELNGNGADPINDLTPKEREFLREYARTPDLKTVADKLGMAVKTAEVHRDRIRKKLGLASAKEFAERAHEWKDLP